MTCEGCRAYLLQQNAREIGFPDAKLRLEAEANKVCAALIHLGACQQRASANWLVADGEALMGAKDNVPTISIGEDNA